MGTYDVAQVCLNGHLVTGRYASMPERRQAFCTECGAATIAKCPHCNQNLRGYFDVEGVISLGRALDVAAYCYGCGRPYPWTAAKLEAARAMADELEELNGAERDELKKSIDLIAADTPMTEVGVTKFKKMLKKLLPESAAAMRRFAIDVAGKTAAELLKGQG